VGGLGAFFVGFARGGGRGSGYGKIMWDVDENFGVHMYLRKTNAF